MKNKNMKIKEEIFELEPTPWLKEQIVNHLAGLNEQDHIKILVLKKNLYSEKKKK